MHVRPIGPRSSKAAVGRIPRALCLALLSCLGGLAAAQPAEEAGIVKTARGQAFIERGEQRLPAEVGVPVHASDKLLTGPDGAVGITLRDNTLLSAGPNAQIEIQRFAFNSTTNGGTLHAEVKRGSLLVVSGKIAKATPEGVRFTTPTTTMGLRGTAFVIDVGPGEN